MKQIAFLLGFILVLAACSGGTAVTLQDIPAYPEATALQPGADPVADTLVDNMAQDAQLRSGIGVGGQTTQMAYRLPAGTSWDQVQRFYNDQLGGTGWKSGPGGMAGNLASGIMDSVNQGNDLFQTGTWSKGKQTLTLVRVADNATAEDASILILSLTTN